MIPYEYPKFTATTDAPNVSRRDYARGVRGHSIRWKHEGWRIVGTLECHEEPDGECLDAFGICTLIEALYDDCDNGDDLAEAYAGDCDDTVHAGPVNIAFDSERGRYVWRYADDWMWL